jgi:hypothetical protein
MARLLGGQSAFPPVVTLDSVTSFAAASTADNYRQRSAETAGTGFAHEFERSTASQERTPSRHSSNSVKQRKQNSADQPAGESQPSPVTTPQVLQDDPRPDLNRDESAAAAVGGAPEQPNAVPGPQLATPDPQATAFTLRMQVAVAAGAAALQQELTGLNAAGIKKTLEDDSQPSAQVPAELALQQGVAAAFQQNSQLSFGDAIRQVSAPSQPPDLQALNSQEAPKAPEALSHILLEVGQSANEKVLVRLVQQAGELRLAVRTDDAELTHGLQQGLSDLVGKLQENGYRTEAWKPVQAAMAPAPAAESQNTSNHSNQQDAPTHSGGSQHDGGQRHQNQSNTPRWVEELESSLTSRTPIAGESHGLTN